MSSSVVGRMMVVVVSTALVNLRESFPLSKLSSLTRLHRRVSNPQNVNSPRCICQN